MQTRDYKNFARGNMYHVYNRGNNYQDVFLDHFDYSTFLNRLSEYIQGNESGRRKRFARGSFSVICYCLMPNHFHLVIKQNTEISLDKLMLSLMTSYAKYFNKKHGRMGHLFQDQYKIKNVFGDEYFKWLFRYVHKNPVKAGLVNQVNDYSWSSYHEYINLTKSGMCDFEVARQVFGSYDEIKSYLR